MGMPGAPPSGTMPSSVTCRGSRLIGGAPAPGQSAATFVARSATVGCSRRVRASVDASERHLHLVAVLGESSPGPYRQAGRGTSVDLGVGCVGEAQLDPPSEQVLQVEPQIVAAVGAHDDVHAVAGRTPGQLRDRRLELLELGAERRPVVDDDEHVAVALVGEVARGSGEHGRPRCHRGRGG